MKIDEALKIFKDNGLPITEAYMIIRELTKKPKEFIIAHPEYEFENDDEFLRILNERLKGIPLAYLINKKSFFKYEFYIERGVLIPRPETELLVENAIDIIKSENIKTIAEIGVGSGAIVVSILLETDCIACGTDISQKAIKVTEKNAKNYGVDNRLILRHGKFLEPFKDVYDSIELIVSNPPYVKTTAKLSKEVLNEPKEALFAGEDGLEFYKEFLNKYDLNNKIVIMEIGHDQGDFFRKKGWEVLKDYSRNDRIVIKDFRR